MAEIELEHVHFRYPESGGELFADLSLALPSGIVSLVGQNGAGKTTLLLLAGGVLLPNRGRVLLRGIDTRRLRDEEERHRHVSFVYQNLEFESEEPIRALLAAVYDHGHQEEKRPSFLEELIEVFQLGTFLARKTQEISKGELQRVILAFSLLYGSRVLMLDEPIFALEEAQKRRAMEFICAYARSHGLSVYYSVHELEISQRYSDYLLLLSKSAPPRLGPTGELFTRRNIEEAYEVPFPFLKRKELFFRRRLLEGRGGIGAWG